MNGLGIETPGWVTHVLLSVEVARDPATASNDGLGHMLRLLARHALKACFFVDPLASAFVDDLVLRKTVAAIIDAGQDVQLYLAAPVVAGRRPALIANARQRLVDAGAPEPIGFRGPEYPDDTLFADLAELGFGFDTSLEGPAPSGAGLPDDQISPVVRHGVIELPVTRIVDGDILRPLRLPEASFTECRAAILHAEERGMPLVTLALRCDEAVDPVASAPAISFSKRLHELCAFLSHERKRFPTAFLSELRDIPLDRPSIPLPDPPLRRVGRIIGQAWSDHIGDRLG